MINAETRCLPLRPDPVKRRREPVFSWTFYEFHLQSKALQKPQEHQLPERLTQKSPALDSLVGTLQKPKLEFHLKSNGWHQRNIWDCVLEFVAGLQLENEDQHASCCVLT